MNAMAWLPESSCKVAIEYPYESAPKPEIGFAQTKHQERLAYFARLAGSVKHLTSSNELSVWNLFKGGQTTMFMLRIEHAISSFEGWKKAFDSDPVGREKMGVRRYRILRPRDEANYVMIDLEFDTAEQAEALLAAMRTVWGRVEGKIMMRPQVRVVEVVETKEY